MLQQLIKILFFGTSEFAVPALKKLHKSPDFEIVAVVTQPDKPAGRKQEPLPSPVKRAALELGLPILQPENLNSPFPSLIKRGDEGSSHPDLFVVASYGKIIPKEILDIPKYGSLNIHASLLPKYRGASPIHAAILNGDTETGVTIIKMDEKVDHGPVVAQSKINNLKSKIRYKELHDELAELGADLLIEVLPKYVSGEIKPVPQDHEKATLTKIITKDDAKIDWSKSAEEIERQIRAYEEWPVAWTVLDGKRIKIYEADTPTLSPPSLERGGDEEGVGEVEIRGNKLFVQCGQGVLELKTLQEEGGKKMTAREYLRGHRNLQNKAFI